MIETIVTQTATVDAALLRWEAAHAASQAAFAAVITTLCPEPTPLPPFNHNVCPQCRERCGDLINGQCLGCEIGWNERFQGAEDIETYTCKACDQEFGVLVAQDENGAWLLVDGDAEKCPACGKWGSALAESDPDTYWNAAERAEKPDAVIETAGGPIQFFFI